jgi:hypothetical protein
MASAEVTRRTILCLTASLLLTGVLVYIAERPSTHADSLPARLSDQEFWNIVTGFSEAGGYFRSDNFLSNEAGYQQVIPVLRRTVRSGGVYLGVGPEQNFTYIVGLEPKMAFVIDIRRQNMLEHLFYKALMELSVDRAEFLSKLFARPSPPTLGPNSNPDDLVDAYLKARPSAALFEANLRLILDFLEKTKGFALSSEDETAVRHVYQAFFNSGPQLTYTFLGGYGAYSGMPTYADLMTENDGHKRNWHFLASEHQFRFVQNLQKNNMIVPIVGDFAGPRAIRSVAGYLREHKAVLSAFYTSNVEQYLFQDYENWRRFYSNVEALPVDFSSTFIRYVLNSWRFSRHSRSQVSSIEETIRAYNRGRIKSYYDVIDMSR